MRFSSTKPYVCVIWTKCLNKCHCHAWFIGWVEILFIMNHSMMISHFIKKESVHGSFLDYTFNRNNQIFFSNLYSHRDKIQIALQQYVNNYRIGLRKFYFKILMGFFSNQILSMNAMHRIFKKNHFFIFDFQSGCYWQTTFLYVMNADRQSVSHRT